MYFVALFVLFPAEEKNFKVWGQFFPVIAITKNEPREQFCRPRPKAEAGNGSRGSFFCDQDNWKKLSETWKFIYEAAWNRKNQCNRVLFCIFPIIIEKNFPIAEGSHFEIAVIRSIFIGFWWNLDNYETILLSFNKNWNNAEKSLT